MVSEKTAGQSAEFVMWRWARLPTFRAEGHARVRPGAGHVEGQRPSSATGVQVGGDPAGLDGYQVAPDAWGKEDGSGHQ